MSNLRGCEVENYRLTELLEVEVDTYSQHPRVGTQYSLYESG